MMTATTNRKFFNELIKSPLFFMEQKCEHYEKQGRNCIEIEEHYFIYRLGMKFHLAYPKRK